MGKFVAGPLGSLEVGASLFPDSPEAEEHLWSAVNDADIRLRYRFQ